ncbi:MAG: hypothetical protein ACREQ1_07255 [Woeseiaceae bacterium]
MGKNFVILFEEKEGSTPIVRLLDNFNAIDIVHQVSNTGWEPFDLHCCGPISMRNYLRCLELIYNHQTPYMQELNRIYTATATHPLEPFDKGKSVGFKMRFQAQRTNVWLRQLLAPAFTSYSINRFRANDVVVFVTVRQDAFRWALSKYHGDGTGKPGHLQFKLARGKIDRPQIPKIHVDLSAFGRLLERCERQIALKRRLVARLNRNGVSAWPMLYESFCNDKRDFFADVLSRLEVPSTDDEITAALEKGTRFEKVHDHNIREFVVNADDVMEEFGERYVRW